MSTAIGRPLIVEVRQGSLDDGDGLRSVVFFKGCPLRCSFCHNPEAQRRQPELLIGRSRCLGCGACQACCSHGAASVGDVDRGKCALCGACVDECPTNARTLVGREVSAQQLAQELGLDRAIYESSGGGVTLSGGEPTLFLDYAAALCRLLREQGIHLLLQTCGDFDWAPFAAALLPLLDQVQVDLKLVDPAQHLRITGRGNERILSNIERLLEIDRPSTEVRLPLVPGITATKDNLSGVARWLLAHGRSRLTVLPYNDLWRDKAQGLGREVDPGLPRRITEREIVAACEHLRAAGLEIRSPPTV